MNLLCPEFVRPVCGTLDRVLHAFAALDRQAVASIGPLQHKYKDSTLRKYVRA